MCSVSSIRHSLRQQRQSLSKEQQWIHAQRVAEMLHSQSGWSIRRRVGVFLSFDGELDLTPTANLLIENHFLFLPVLQTDKTLLFSPWSMGSSMTANALGILEPKTDERCSVADLDLLCVPLVGVDRQGNRLGMGGGYYDRTLGGTALKPYLLGVAHSCQLVDVLPAAPWDVPLDALITEQGMINWRPWPW